MRILAALLLLVAMILSAILGGGYAISSRYQKFAAEVKADGMSSVSSDLVSAEELAKMRAADKARKAKDKGLQSAGRKHLLVGVALLIVTALLLVAAVLLLANRAARLRLGAVAVALVACVALIAVEGGAMLLLLDGALVLVGAVLSFLARTSARAKPAEPRPAEQ